MKEITKKAIENFNETLIEWSFLLIPTLIGILILVVISLIFWVAFGIYADNQSEVFQLKKAEWVCLESKEHRSTTYVKSGDVLVPITTTVNECVNWRKTF